MRSRTFWVAIIAAAFFLTTIDFARAGEGFGTGSETDPKLLDEYKVRAADVRDAGGHLKLALWCEQKGLVPEREKHLVLAALGSNATARGLLGQVADGEKWRRPETLTRRALSDADLTNRLAEYEDRRAKAGETAEAQWKLGLWCEKNGLEAEAKAHFGAALRLDPKRDAIWKRLGYKKRDGRWTTDEQLAAAKVEAETQRKANRRWGVVLEKVKTHLATKEHRAAAEKTLADVTDARAIPSIWRTFVNDGKSSAADQDRAVQLFGQIDAPQASRALVAFAVFGKTSAIRQAATQTLRKRDPREFMDLLISLLRNKIKYELRPGGPNTAGALFVEGKQFNVETLYRMPQLTSPVGIDAFGMPVMYTGEDAANYYNLAMNAVNAVNAAGPASPNPISRGVVSNIAAHPNQAPTLLGQNLNQNNLNADTAFMNILEYQRMVELRTQIALQTARQLAMAVEQKLVQDVAALQAYNQATEESNLLIATILVNVTGQDLGKNIDDWRSWWADQQGYVFEPEKPRPKPTIELKNPIAFIQADGSLYFHTACFAAGTRVSTKLGPRPIETIKVGDLVLSQDPTTGALGFQPVLVAHRNPASATLRLSVDNGDVVEVTGIHRFWVAGRGWVMARDLRSGDELRVLGGVSRVVEVVPSGKVEKVVYNLDVASNRDYFVGKTGLLAHDNSLPLPRAKRFDSP